VAEPYSKSRQLGLKRRPRRVFRKRAGKREWAAIIEAKLGPCRVCNSSAPNGRVFGRIHMHHLVPRSWGGDDVAENIAPLCPICHEAVTTRDPRTLQVLARSLTIAEHAYIVGRLGAAGPERLFGVPV